MMVHRPRVGITQRQVLLPDRGEVRDALDVRLPRLLLALGFHPVPIPTLLDGVDEHLDAAGLDAVVLSGGDDVGMTPERDVLEGRVLDHAEERRLPVLGICRGFQMLTLRAGGSITLVEGHAGTRHGLAGPWAGDRVDVNSYHRHGLLPGRTGSLQGVASAPDGTVEAAVHPDLPWAGIMWHPERESTTHAADGDLLVSVLMGGRPGGRP